MFKIISKKEYDKLQFEATCKKFFPGDTSAGYEELDSLRETVKQAKIIIQKFVPKKLLGTRIKETFENIKKYEEKEQMKKEIIEELSVCTKRKGGK